jgi:hypothetical protein
MEYEGIVNELVEGVLSAKEAEKDDGRNLEGVCISGRIVN